MGETGIEALSTKQLTHLFSNLKQCHQEGDTKVRTQSLKALWFVAERSPEQKDVFLNILTTSLSSTESSVQRKAFLLLTYLLHKKKIDKEQASAMITALRQGLMEASNKAINAFSEIVSKNFCTSTEVTLLIQTFMALLNKEDKSIHGKILVVLPYLLNFLSPRNEQ